MSDVLEGVSDPPSSTRNKHNSRRALSMDFVEGAVKSKTKKR